MKVTIDLLKLGKVVLKALLYIAILIALYAVGRRGLPDEYASAYLIGTVVGLTQAMVGYVFYLSPMARDG